MTRSWHAGWAGVVPLYHAVILQGSCRGVAGVRHHTVRIDGCSTGFRKQQRGCGIALGPAKRQAQATALWAEAIAALKRTHENSEGWNGGSGEH